MGLSLSVLVALYLLLPGIAFYFALSRLHRSNKPSTALDQQVSVGLAISVFASVVLQAAGYSIAELLHYAIAYIPSPDPGSTLLLLSGTVTGPLGARAIAAAASTPGLLAIYVVLLTFAGARAGRSWNKRFRRSRDADYYELLHKAGVAFTVVTVDVQIGSNCFLYSGIAVEFSTTSDGSLARVVLEGTLRKPHPYEAPVPPDENNGWVDIPGEFCVLQLKSCNTVNVDYWYTDEDGGSLPGALATTSRASPAPL